MCGGIVLQQRLWHSRDPFLSRMKIGVIADIHGEIKALHSALNLLESNAVDQIVCAGDLVDRGPDGDAVVSLIREREIPCVQGNHDQLADVTQSFYARHPELAFPSLQLNPDSLDYLKDLPPILTFEWEERSIYLTHANPWQDATLYLYPRSSYLQFFDVIAAAKADIVILGHTHTPMVVRILDTLIVNPGSVYANRGMNGRTCGILSLPDCTFDLFNIDTGEQITLEVNHL